MKYHLEKGTLHDEKLSALAESFGITNFKLDRDKWLTRERSILARLRSSPFFQIKELVVWEKEELDAVLEITKRARNIRYNPETQSWERRVLTEWRVPIRTNRGGYGAWR